MNERVLVVSSTFPQYDGDPRGRFLCRHWERHAAATGAEVRVLAPHTRWVDGSFRSPLDIVRFHYAPHLWSTLTGRFGILENLRESPLRASLVPLYWHSLAARLADQLRAFRPDRVVAHMLLPNGWHVAKQCAATGIPYDLYGHGTDVDLLLGLSRVRHCAVVDMLSRANQVFLPSREKLERLRNQLGDDVITCRLGVETMAHVVDPPADNIAAPRGPRRDTTGVPRVLFMGRLIRQKGVDTLLEAMARVQSPVAVDIAGDGPQRRRLERSAIRLGIDARFVGYVQGAAQAELYRRASLLCVPSRELGRWSEGAPLVLLEARQHALPIVATHVGGIPELCDGHDDAILVAPDNPTVLARAIEQSIRASRRVDSRTSGSRLVLATPRVSCDSGRAA